MSDLFGNDPIPKAERPSGQFGRVRRITRADRAMAGHMTPKRLAANTRRSLNTARSILERLAAPWAEIDNTVEFNLGMLLVAFDEFESDIQGSVEWLLEDVTP